MRFKYLYEKIVGGQKEYPFQKCHSLDGKNRMDLYSEDQDIIFNRYNTNLGNLTVYFKNTDNPNLYNYRNLKFKDIYIEKVGDKYQIEVTFFFFGFIPFTVLIYANSFETKVEKIDRNTMAVNSINKTEKHNIIRNFVFSFVFFFLSACSVLIMNFITNNDSNGNLLAIIALSGVPIFMIPGCIFYFSTNHYRKKYEAHRIYDENFPDRLTSFFSFFRNKYATIFDILFIAILISSSILANINLKSENEMKFFTILLFFIIILAFEMHLVLNGKNFNYFYNVFHYTNASDYKKSQNAEGFAQLLFLISSFFK